jgi:hypothetical protein
VLMCVSIKTMMKNEKFVEALSRPRSSRVYLFASADFRKLSVRKLSAGRSSYSQEQALSAAGLWQNILAHTKDCAGWKNGMRPARAVERLHCVA